MLNLDRSGRILPRERVDPGFPAYLRGKVVVLTAYFDESARGDDILIVGGFVSTADKWINFSEACEQIKSDFSIPYVHAVKLFDLKSTRIYGHLSMERRIRVASELARLISEFAEFSIVETVIPRRFNLLTTKEWRDQNGAPYQTCFTWILAALHDYLCVPNKEHCTVSIFIEDGHPNVGGAEEILSGYKFWSEDDPDVHTIREKAPLLKIGGYGRLTKEMSPPLWAADLIAYSFYRQVVHKDEFFTDMIDSIERKVPIIGHCIDEEIIRYMDDAAIEARAIKSEWEKDIHETVKHFQQFGVKAIKHKKGVLLDFSDATPRDRPKLSES